MLYCQIPHLRQNKTWKCLELMLSSGTISALTKTTAFKLMEQMAYYTVITYYVFIIMVV